jgi:hypothetical protein
MFGYTPKKKEVNRTAPVLKAVPRTVASAIAPLKKIIEDLKSVRGYHAEQAGNKGIQIASLNVQVDGHNSELSAADKQISKIEDLIN